MTDRRCWGGRLKSRELVGPGRQSGTSNIQRDRLCILRRRLFGEVIPGPTGNSRSRSTAKPTAGPRGAGVTGSVGSVQLVFTSLNRRVARSVAGCTSPDWRRVSFTRSSARRTTLRRAPELNQDRGAPRRGLPLVSATEQVGLSIACGAKPKWGRDCQAGGLTGLGTTITR